jgi:hypothetical protein
MNIRPPSALLAALVVAATSGCADNPDRKQEAEKTRPASIEQPPAEEARVSTPDDVVRLEADEVNRQVQAGEALLVCAYDSDEKFQRNRLAGAIPFSAFEQRLPSLSKDQPIVFYCS